MIADKIKFHYFIVIIFYLLLLLLLILLFYPVCCSKNNAAKLLPRFSRAKSANYAALMTQVLNDATKEQIDVMHVNQVLQSSKAYQVKTTTMTMKTTTMMMM
jgi:hypothetical protein